MPQSTDDHLCLLDRLLVLARKAGADAADAVAVDQRSLSLSWRLGAVELAESSEGADIGLRVFFGRRQAIVSSSDLTADALDDLVSRAIAMARAAPEDPYCGLADPGELASDTPDLDTFDPTEPDPDSLREQAAAAEAAALAVPGVSNSEGAEAGSGIDHYVIAGTNGLARAYARSWHSLSVCVLAGEGTSMERDYDYTSAVHLADLRDPATIGRHAGEQAVRRVHPRKIESTRMPVVFAPRVARSLLGHLTSAINGDAIARGTSFLKDKLGELIFDPAVTVIDDPLRRRGLRSRPVDAEGLATAARRVIDRGRLTTWILDLRSSRQLGLRSTGHAVRGPGSLPSPATSNLFLEAGSVKPEDLIADIDRGLYVTDLMGFGINGVTGDYSRGAAGFCIERGDITYPVSEITISGNLLDMFRRLIAADDLEFRYGTDAPTIRIDGMTVAGR
jgi:PmbA protein